MTDWFVARSLRERLLLGAALVMLILTIALLGLGQLSDLNAQQHAEVKRASQTLDRIATLRPAAATASTLTPRLSPDDLRRKILGTASTRGLDVTEVRMEPGKQISVQLGEAKSDIIFAWLVDLETKMGVQIANASMTEIGGGLVRSRFEFELAATP